MSTAILTTPVTKFANGEQWHQSIGEVPLSRVVFNPWPGTATEADLIRLVDSEKRLVELIDGTLVEKTVGYDEADIAGTILTAIRNFLKHNKLGKAVGGDGPLRMTSRQIRLPDVSFTSFADMPDGKKPPGPVPQMPPTLAVEVISKGNTAAEMRLKITQYFESGSKLVWMVYPKTLTVEVFDRDSQTPSLTVGIEETLNADPAIPGFAISVRDIFDI